MTARLDPAIKAAIAAMPEDGWTPVRYPRAVWDDQLGCWISDAEIAGAAYTAFKSKKGKAITARLVVRRVRDHNPKALAGQGELIPAWWHHAIFTDSPFILAQAEGDHRDYAVAEQVFTDWASGPLAHSPSGKFTANAAGLALAAIAHNLTRAADALASRRHAKARGATIRADLISVAARLARHERGHPDPASPGRLAPPGRVDEPVRGRLRPARQRGLTSPDQVTPDPRPPAGHPRKPPSAHPDKPQDRSAAGQPHPPTTIKITITQPRATR